MCWPCIIRLINSAGLRFRFIGDLLKRAVEKGRQQYWQAAKEKWHNACYATFDHNKTAYGLNPMPPSKVRVSPERYLKSGEASCTQTRPISFSTSP